MPRYFFNVRDGNVVPDQLGVELAGPEEARLQAKRLIEVVRGFFDERTFWIIVTDASGETICEINSHEI